MSAPAPIDGYQLCASALAATSFDVAPLLELAGGSETDWLELKQAPSPREPWKIAKAIAALTNTHGGCVLLGVDDAAGAVGLAAFDPNNMRQTQGGDALIRHLEQSLLRPRTGWPLPNVPNGRLNYEQPPPHDLLEVHRATLSGTEILAVLVRPRPAGQRCLHWVEGTPEKERVFLPVRKLGAFGRVSELVRPAEIEEWNRQREPQQLRYAELLAQASGLERGAPRAPLGLEDRIAAYHAGLRSALDEVDRCFVSLDAEESEAVAPDSQLVPWAEEYLAEDLGWDDEEEVESEAEQAAPGGESRPARSGPVFDLLAGTPRAILLGEPGAGKTTCLKRLALRAVANQRPGGAVALFVPLSRYRGPGDLAPLMVRASVTAVAGGALSRADLDHLMASGRLLLLLDAINECPDAHAESCVREIARLLELHPEVPVTLTSRAIGWRRQLPLPAFVVRPLDSDRQEELLTSLLGDPGRAGEIHSRLLSLPGGAAVASNPLILRMAIQVFRTDGDLPPGRALLYRRFVELWYARESRKAKNGGAPLPWSERTARAALARLAFCARAESGRVVQRSRAEEALRQELEDPAVFLDRLGQGLLLRCADGEVDFTHETFQEYLAAEHCLAQPEALAWTRSAFYRHWGMVLAYAHELSRSAPPKPIVEAAWRMNPWLGAVVARSATAMPKGWEGRSGLTPFVLECLKALVGQKIAGASEVPTMAGPWYRRDDLPLRYVVTTDPAIRDRWKRMESRALSLAWHPGMAIGVLKRVLIEPLELMAGTWPRKADESDSRTWRVPKTWIKKANPVAAQRLITLGVASTKDFAPRRQSLAETAAPEQARDWISAGIMKATDFSARRQEWIAGATPTTTIALLAARICTPEELGHSRERFIERASVDEAIALAEAGLVEPQAFRARLPGLIGKVPARTASQLIAAGICTPDDFTDRKANILQDGSPLEALKWYAKGVFTKEDLASCKERWVGNALPEIAVRLVKRGICQPEDFATRRGALWARANPKMRQRLIDAGICAEDEAPAPLTPTVPDRDRDPGADSALFRRDSLADESRRTEIEKRLEGRVIEAEVGLALGRASFLAHEEFPHGIFCFVDPEPNDGLRLKLGDRVACKVSVRFDPKRNSWGFVATDVRLVRRAAAK